MPQAPKNPKDVDIFVAGLGPAGTSVVKTLMERSSGEFSIVAVDRRARPGFPVTCGEFMPSLSELKTLLPDVSNHENLFNIPKALISTTTKTVSFVDPWGEKTTTRFDGYTMHRGNWLEELVKGAEKKGVEVFLSSRVISLNNGCVRVNTPQGEIFYKPRILVGCDGVKSRIAQWTGLEEPHSLMDYVICKQHYVEGVDMDPSEVLMFFGKKYAPGAYAWIIPKGNGRANVGIGLRKPFLQGGLTVSKALENLWEHPLAYDALEGAKFLNTIGGTVPVGLPNKRLVTGFSDSSQAVIAGNAAGQVVSSVGAGIPTSIVAGNLLGNTILKSLRNGDSLNSYERESEKEMGKVLHRSYRLRKVFDKISNGSDEKMRWYLRRLSKRDLGKALRCQISLKVRAFMFFFRI